MKEILITRRVVHLGGYDPVTPTAFFARFNRELARSAACWNATVSTHGFVADDERAVWISEMRGPGWTAITEHELLRWDDVIAGHRSGSTMSRWLRGIAAFLDFSVHGALWRYLAIAWRYAVFFLYPFAMLVAAFALSIIVFRTLAAAIGLPFWLGLLIGLGAAFAASYAMVRQGHIGHLLDDWDFAKRLIRSPDPVISGRLQAASARLAALPPDIDVQVVGHSLGAVLAVELLDHAIGQLDPPRDVRFIALGSSILKLALHDKATALRGQLERVNSSGRIRWIEYQSLSDVMNFYKTDPVRLLKLDGPSPIVRQVRFKRMLNPDYYRKIKTNFFRLHCQFVSGNDQRAAFDYMIVTCGPFSPEKMAQSTDGAVNWLDADGALTSLGRAALLPERSAPPDAPN